MLQLALTTTATSVHVVHEAHCPDIGPICNERPEPPQLHDQRFYILEMRLTGAYALSDAIGLELQFPFKLDRTTVKYERLDGTPFTPDYPAIHHRNETLWGPGDPWLLGRYTPLVAGLDLTTKLGVSLPLGSTEENPFALGEMGLEHQHIQLGTGTIDPVAIVDVGRRLGERYHAALHGQMELVLYENSHGYRAGSRYAVGLQGHMSIRPWLSVSVMGDVVGERPERWDGEVLQDGNLGRTDVLVGAGAMFHFGSYSVGAGVRAPVYQNIVQVGDEAGQLSYPAVVDLSVERSFGVLGR